MQKFLSIFDLPHFMRYSASGLNAKPHIHLQWLLILVNPIQTNFAYSFIDKPGIVPHFQKLWKNGTIVLRKKKKISFNANYMSTNQHVIEN